MLKNVFVFVRLVYLESGSLIPHLPPQCFVVTTNSASPFVLWDVVGWAGVGWGPLSQPASLRGPALVAPWILEVSYSVVSLALGQQLVWVAGMFI